MTLAYVLGFFATVAVVYAWILLSIDGSEGATMAMRSGAAVFPCPKEPVRFRCGGRPCQRGLGPRRRRAVALAETAV